MTKEEAHAERVAAAKRYLAGERVKLTHRIRVEIRKIDPTWALPLIALREDRRRPRVIHASGLVLEQTATQEVFTGMVLGWRGLKR